MFYIQYRGPHTINYINNLIKIDAPIIPIYMTRKLKTVLPSLKPKVERNLNSNVTYKMNCSGCDSSYVGMTSRHLITRLKEHFLPDGVMTKHFKTCQTSLDPFTCGKILAKTNRNVLYLSILEALHIREEKPNLNVKDEFKGRLLRIRI